MTIITIITIIAITVDSILKYLKPPTSPRVLQHCISPVEFLHYRDQKGQSLTGSCPCFTQNIPTSIAGTMDSWYSHFAALVLGKI